MALSRIHPISWLCFLLLGVTIVSCVRIESPGIMPPHETDVQRQWRVLHQGFVMVQTEAGQNHWQWQIIARYIPEGEDGELTPFDLSADLDGVTVPFTFEKDGQIFESMTSFPLEPGPHQFSLSPSRETGRVFPTLTVDFEAP